MNSSPRSGIKITFFVITSAALLVLVVAFFIRPAHDHSSVGIAAAVESRPAAGNASAVSPVGSAKRPERPAARSKQETLELLRERLATGDPAVFLLELKSCEHAIGDEIWVLVKDAELPESIKRDALVQAIRLLAKSHGAEDLIAFVNRELGDGMRKAICLGYILRYCEVPADRFAALLGGMNDSQTVSNMVNQYAIRLGGGRDLHLDDLSLLAKSGPQGVYAVMMTLVNHPTSLQGEPIERRDARLENVSRALKNLIETGAITPEVAGTVITGLGGSMPFQVHEQLQKAGALALIDPANRAKLEGQMAAKDPQRFLDLAVVSQGRMLPGSGFAGLLANDEQEAAQWLNAHQTTLDPAQKDDIYRAWSTHHARRDKIEDAWANVNLIADPAVRKSAEGAVWSRERNMVRQLAAVHPASALDAMVQGSSRHHDYWMEEVITTWASNDHANAVAWYEKNWSSLPVEKAQYVAAGFASNALQKKDLDAAREWLQYIKDPKTRQRIESAVQSAGGS